MAIDIEYTIHRAGRGWDDTAENCLEGVEKSESVGADGIETDGQVVLDRNGKEHIVLFHGWDTDLNDLTNVDDLLNSFVKQDPTGAANSLNGSAFLTNDWPRVAESLAGNGFLRDESWIRDLLDGNVKAPGINLAAVNINIDVSNVDLTKILKPAIPPEERGQLPVDFPDGLTSEEIEALRKVYHQHKHPNVDLTPFASKAKEGTKINNSNLSKQQLDAIRSLYLFSVAGADLSHAKKLTENGPLQLKDFNIDIDSQRCGLDALRHMYMAENPDFLAKVDPNPERILDNTQGITDALTNPPSGWDIKNIDGVDLSELLEMTSRKDLKASDMNLEQLIALKKLYAEANPDKDVDNPPDAVNLRRLHTLKLQDPKAKGTEFMAPLRAKGILYTTGLYLEELRALRLKTKPQKNGVRITTTSRMPTYPELLKKVYKIRLPKFKKDKSIKKFVTNLEIKPTEYIVRYDENHPTRPLEAHIHPKGHPNEGQVIVGQRDIAKIIKRDNQEFADDIKKDNDVRVEEIIDRRVSSFDPKVLGQTAVSDPKTPRSKLISSFTPRDWRVNKETQRIEYREQQEEGKSAFTPGPWKDARPETPPPTPSWLAQDRLYSFTDEAIIDAIDNHKEELRDPNHRDFARYTNIVKKRNLHERVWDLTLEELKEKIDKEILKHVTTDIDGNVILPAGKGIPAMISISAANLTPTIVEYIQDVSEKLGLDIKLKTILWTTEERDPANKTITDQLLQLESFKKLGITGVISDHPGMVKFKQLDLDFEHPTQKLMEQRKKDSFIDAQADGSRMLIPYQRKKEKEESRRSKMLHSIQRRLSISQSSSEPSSDFIKKVTDKFSIKENELMQISQGMANLAITAKMQDPTSKAVVAQVKTNDGYSIVIIKSDDKDRLGIAPYRLELDKEHLVGVRYLAQKLEASSSKTKKIGIA